MMLRQVLHMFYQRSGREAVWDADLPTGLLAHMAVSRAGALTRGLLRLRRPVFLEPGVQLRGRRHLRIGSGASIGRGSSIDGYAREGVVLGPAARLGAHCTITCTSHVSRLGTGFRLGARSGLGDFCHVGASGGVYIGEDVITGSYVSFHSQEHVYDRPDVPIRLQGTTESGIRIGDNCWLGARVTVLDGSQIGHGSVVAAGAVVRGEFPERSLIAGVPARLIRRIGVE